MDYNRRLLDLARANAARFIAQTDVKAILLTGSVGRGQADGWSDIDMILYYEVLPTQAMRDAIFAEAGGTERRALFDDPEAGSAEQYLVEGVACQFAHLTVASAERDLADVVEQYSVAPDKHAVAGGILDGRALHGEEIIASWKAKAAAYPELLTEAVIHARLRFHPLWVLEKMIAGRGDLLFLMEQLTVAIKNVLEILCALNRTYAPHEWKRMEALLAGLEIAPDDLPARIRHILRDEPTTAIAELGRLIEDTLDLVEKRLPAIDTHTVRTWLHSAPTGLGPHS